MRSWAASWASWTVRAALAAMLGALFDVLGAVLTFPTAASNLPGLGVALVGSWWIQTLWTIPLAAILGVLEARGLLSRLFAWRGALFHVMVPAVLTGVALLVASAPAFEQLQVEIRPLRALLLFAAVASAWGAFLLAGAALRRWAPQLTEMCTRNGALYAAALGAVLSWYVAQYVLISSNTEEPLAPLAVVFLVCLLLVVYRLTQRWSRVPLGLAGATTALWLVAGVSWPASPHAVFVVRGHCPFALALYDPWDRALDFDGDGTIATYLGGTDCAAFDGAIGPASIEIPGDAIDQDCRGGDAAIAHPAPLAAPWPGCLPPRPASVLIVTVDALRADAVTAELAPQLALFASQAVRFEHAYSPATMTGGSTLSIFAGKAVSDLNEHNVLMESEIHVGETLPHAFLDAGYHTFSLLGFQLHGDIFRYFQPLQHARPRDRVVHTHKRLLAASLTNQVIEEIEGTSGPYLGWVHYPDLHAPYLLREAADAGTAPGYLRALSYTDAHIGRLLRWLHGSGRLANTIVVVTSDHGEQLGKRGREGHGPLAFEESIHVPLVLWVPGCTARQLPYPVSLRHLTGTLAALTGIGRAEPTWFAPSTLPTVAEATWTGIKRAVIVGSHKLIVDARFGGRMLFDLNQDPGELQNLYGSDAELARSLEHAYQQWLDAPGWR